LFTKVIVVKVSEMSDWKMPIGKLNRQRVKVSEGPTLSEREKKHTAQIETQEERPSVINVWCKWRCNDP
jgi:hypothetical protein